MSKDTHFAKKSYHLTFDKVRLSMWIPTYTSDADPTRCSSDL
jgi:hypothetical protein